MGSAEETIHAHLLSSCIHLSNAPAPSSSNQCGGLPAGWHWSKATKTKHSILQRQQQQQKKISIGDNKQLTTEFRKESERRKRQTEAPKPDGIMGKERRKQEYKEGVGLSDWETKWWMRPKRQWNDDSLMDEKMGKWRDKGRQMIRWVEAVGRCLWDHVLCVCVFYSKKNENKCDNHDIIMLVASSSFDW